MSRSPSLRLTAATLAVLGFLAVGPQGRADDGDAEAAARQVEALRELALQELRDLRLGDALRHFDAALQVAEDGDLPGAAAALRLYRGFVLAVLQQEGAERDLDRFVDHATRLAPEHAPLAAALRDQVLGLARGDVDLVVRSFEAIGETYGDRLPPVYFQGLELMSLFRAERFREAGALCRDLLAGDDLEAAGASERSVRALGLSCSVADVLAGATETGLEDEDLLRLGRELLAAVPDQPGPVQEPLRLLLEQLRVGGSGDSAAGSWASSSDFLTPAALFHRAVAQAVPVGLREGLDGLLAAMIEDLVAIKAGSGEAAAAYLLAELTRARSHLDRLTWEAQDPSPADPTDERRRP